MDSWLKLDMYVPVIRTLCLGVALSFLPIRSQNISAALHLKLSVDSSEDSEVIDTLSAEQLPNAASN